MKTITDCAILYKELLNKKYKFIIEGNLSFILEFSPSNFYHLLGLEKLTDVTQLMGASPTKIFKDIIRGRITHSVIAKSNRYHLISERIQFFEYLPKLLDFDKSNKLIVEFDKRKLNFKSLLRNTKYILYRRNDDKYIHLTIGNKDTLYPETFIIESGSTYISEQVLLDITNIEIIGCKSKKRQR